MENYAGIQIGCFSFRCSRIKPGAEKRSAGLRFSGFGVCGGRRPGDCYSADSPGNGVAAGSCRCFFRQRDFLPAAGSGHCNCCAADVAGMAAAATATELCGRICALFQALPILQDLLDSYAGYLQ